MIKQIGRSPSGNLIMINYYEKYRKLEGVLIKTMILIRLAHTCIHPKNDVMLFRWSVVFIHYCHKSLIFLMEEVINITVCTCSLLLLSLGLNTYFLFLSSFCGCKCNQCFIITNIQLRLRPYFTNFHRFRSDLSRKKVWWKNLWTKLLFTSNDGRDNWNRNLTPF